ncbi:MAG: MFS transporter [Candidatus Eremiobacteraeota bacterium]|nr:MFS transporter [Candidatus Eremiobacteraeota bacterium]
MATFVKHPCEEERARLSPDAGRSSRTGHWVLLVAIVGSSMAFIDSSAVNVALPSIQRDLQTDAAGLQWVVEGYALFLSALILIGGSLGDVFGRRRVFVTGIALFAIASLACANAHAILALNLARCIQGIGGALATPGSLALISANFAGTERGRAIGTWSGFAAITAAIGPLLGGWLAQNASWRYVFLINVPLAAFVIVAALLRVPESRDESGGRSIDVAGALLATAALGSLTFGLIRLQNGASDTLGLATSAAGVLMFAAFVAWEHRARMPMIPPGVFRNVTFSGANVYTLFLYAALGGSLFFVPFDLQNVQGYSPSAAGGAMLPFIVIMFVSSRWSGGLVGTIGARFPLIAGAIVAGFGFLGYARIGVGGSYWTTFFPAALILGVGGALFVAPLTTTVMGAIDTSHAGIASGINNAVARVAGLLAVAALGIVLLTTLYAQFDSTSGALALSDSSRRTLAREHAALGSGKTPEALREPDRTRVRDALGAAYTLGFRRVMIISALLSWLAGATASFTIPRRPRAAPKVPVTTTV